MNTGQFHPSPEPRQALPEQQYIHQFPGGRSGHSSTPQDHTNEYYNLPNIHNTLHRAQIDQSHHTTTPLQQPAAFGNPGNQINTAATFNHHSSVASTNDIVKTQAHLCNEHTQSREIYACNICKRDTVDGSQEFLKFNGPVQLVQHMRGSKHKRTVCRKNVENQRFYCRTCKKGFSGPSGPHNFELHCKSIKHLRRVSNNNSAAKRK